MEAEKRERVYSPTHAECALANKVGWFRESFLKHVSDLQLASIAENPTSATLIVIFEQWADKDRAFWSRILTDPFLKEHAAKTYVICHDDYSAGLLPGCYTSLTPARFDNKWHRSCAYPAVYSWDPTLESLRERSGLAQSATCLYSFRGNVQSHSVRSRLQKSVSEDPECRFAPVTSVFREHTPDQVVEYARDILGSEFVLCPRGHSPCTYRLFEVMQLGRCPVIVADDWIPTQGPDWLTCSIRVAEKDMPRIPEILRRERHRSRKLGEAARLVWEKWFDEQPRFSCYFDSIRSLHSSGETQPPRTISDLHHRLDSWSFSWGAGWTPIQRAWRRLLSLERS